MKKLYSLFVVFISTLLFSQNQKSFHDTQGNIEVNGSGQLQFSLPIALPPGVKSVAPQINLVYTSGSGNGIAGYGWNLSGITAISRVGKNLDKDGENKPIQLTYEDFYSFNGQRLILKSGEYGKDGAEYTTEKYSNVKIKSVGSLSGKNWQGPEYWEVTFEDGSQAWYGVGTEAKTPIEYNITKWKDAQGNYISYEYMQQHNVAIVSAIKWGGNETLNKSHFNQIQFNYAQRDLRESSFVAGQKFIQEKILTSVQVNANGSQFKKYVINYDNGSNGTKYQFVKNITEYNSNNEPANPVTFEYEKSQEIWNVKRVRDENKDNQNLMGDFDGDGSIDILKYSKRKGECIEYSERRRCRHGDCDYIQKCIKEAPERTELYLYRNGFDTQKEKVLLEGNIDFSKEEFIKGVPIVLKNKDGEVKSNQGFAIYRIKHKNRDTENNIIKSDIEIDIYSINGYNLKKEYTTGIAHEYYDKSRGSNSQYINNEQNNEEYTRTRIGNLKTLDLNGDGISELVMDFNDKTCRFNYYLDIRYEDNYGYIEYGDEIVEEVCNPDIYKYIVINTDNGILEKESHSIFQVYPYDKNILDYKMGDFNGDGKIDLLKFDSNKVPFIITFDKDIQTGKYITKEIAFSQNNEKIEGWVEKTLIGDFNGDGKMDLLVPEGNRKSGWYYYLSVGNSFNKGEKLVLTSYMDTPIQLGSGKHHTFFESGCYFDTSEYYKYVVDDIDKDGKSELIVGKVRIHNHQWRAHHDQEYTEVEVDVYSPIKEGGFYENPNSDFDYDSLNRGPFGKFASKTFRYNDRVIPFDMVSLSNSGNKLAILGKPDDCGIDDCESFVLIQADEFKDISKSSRIRSITQGGLKTVVEYKELDPNKNPHFYAGVKSEQYPYMELDKVSQSYAVAQLIQEISPNQFRKQDFRYRGFVTHLQGKGMIGFRQTARSSWYADGFENTKIWSGAEIDPLNEGLPIKEWSIKTNNETEIFPSNLSLNNNQLLSFKETKYKIDHLNGNKVKVIVPTQITTKDFIKNVVSVDKVEYDEYYLPVKTISNTNNGFAEKITTLTYYPPNLTGQGRDYFVGRPRSKTELLKAYGDSKGAKEEYEYENNQLKILRTYNRDNTGYLQETYTYDGFGNIVEKVVSNSIDANTQRSSSRYDDKGRFVIEKTDNLGLITRISYNDWGQVLTQTDPLGNTLTNTYDAWGKHLTATTNLGGTTRFAYEKLANDDAKITEFAPDGGETITYTNKIGQTYKTTTKSFTVKANSLGLYIENITLGRRLINNQSTSQYISKEIRYDALGRKTGESEPYFEGGSASKWNTIEYDEYSRPIKATAFTGKIIKTEYTGNTVNVIETNAHNRFKKQTFDAIGNITSTEDKGGIIQFKYNAAGENIEAKYETNVVTTKYDNWGRKVEFHDPSNGLYRYEYNHGFGLLTKEISPKGEKSYTYNDKGQLISQREVSNDGTSTEKTIHFIYNDKGMLIAKNGTSKGKSFGSSIRYDNFGRVLSAEENSYGKKFEKKNIIYDHLNRVKSYEKSLTSSGETTSTIIEHIYDERSGTLYQIKDEVTGDVLWELKGNNAKGQVTQAQLGATVIRNIYDANGFLSFTIHGAKNNNTAILNISYSFDAIKNELNSRNTGGAFNIIENFVYDDNNRLINWTNPRTGALHFNKYDKQGRIVENDQLGKVKFGNTQKVYQPTSVELNAKGEENLKNNLIQSIGYNENNDPTFINGVKGDVRFEYGLTEMRQMVSFGGEFLSSNPNTDGTSQGKYTRYYSEDGSYEITVDNRTGKEKHILYIGGNPYESEIIFVKDYDEAEGSYKFLHKDYLGSILAISDEEGNKLEQRHYDAWGNLTHLQIGDGEIITDDKIIHNSSLIIDRGYTSHEHFFEVGIIHMNGRLYDPMLRRFLNADENIQDPHNTQNYNKYGYVFNNPLMYNDPSGEIIGIVLGIITSKFFLVGAAVGTATYLINSAIKGTPITLKGFLGAAIKTGMAYYLGGAFNPSSFSMSTGELLLQGAGDVITSILPSWSLSIGDFDFSISPSIAIGKGWGFGANVSATFHAGDFSISQGFGVMYYGNHAGSNEKGWEFRNSRMLGYDNGNWGLSIGTNKWGGLHEQQTGMIGFRKGDFSMMYENDGSILGLGDGGDSYRTAALNLYIKEYNIGFQLFTGYRDYDNENGDVSKHRNSMCIDNCGRRMPNGLVKEEGSKYRLGALYFGYKNYRIGTDSEHVRHAIQDQAIHNLRIPWFNGKTLFDKRQMGFENQSWEWNPYFQYRNKNQFTSW